MKNYYRIMLGRKSAFAEEARKGNFIGTDFTIEGDLTKELVSNWRDFNKKFIPVFIKNNPGKSKISAGLACGMLWTVSKGINIGDIVLCPNGQGEYFVGEITGQYQYKPGEGLPHQRPVQWFHQTISRDDMSPSLRHSAGSIGTVSDISSFAKEIESLISGAKPDVLTTSDETVEDPTVFALESHLEDFLVENWSSTDLGKNYDIFEEDGETVGQQYPSDTGPIDILAISKDKKELLIIELKKGRAEDVVIGQIQRYMGYVKEELAEPGQAVRGAIIAAEETIRFKRALSVTSNIDFYTYEVKFRLSKKINADQSGWLSRTIPS